MTRAEWYQLLKPHLIEHAKQRGQMDYGPGTHRWGEHTEEAGVEGQAAWACLTGAPRPDLRILEFGDGGIDQRVLCNYYSQGQKPVTTDVKGCWKTPRYLIVPDRNYLRPDGRRQIGFVCPEKLYVFASRPPGQGEHGNAFLWIVHGTMWGSKVMQYPAEFFMNNVKFTHKVPVEELDPIEEFMAAYCDQWAIGNEPFKPAVYCEDAILHGGHGLNKGDGPCLTNYSALTA